LNYFAHAYAALQQPTLDGYYLAGLATPDWLNVTARRVKCRSRHAEPYVDHTDPQLAALAQGVRQHHADDGAFHELAAFNELSLEFARRIRNSLGDSTGMRPWFVGHVLVELLLDWALITDSPKLLDDYYSAMATIDAPRVAAGIERFCGQSPGELAWFIGRFLEVRFLADYADNSRLCYRLNQVLSRVNLPELPPEFAGILPEMRNLVLSRRYELVVSGFAL
jgi:hypothetical protein